MSTNSAGTGVAYLLHLLSKHTELRVSRKRKLFPSIVEILNLDER